MTRERRTDVDGYWALWVWLDSLPEADFDGDVGEAIRDQMDKWWPMSDADHAEFRRRVKERERHKKFEAERERLATSRRDVTEGAD